MESKALTKRVSEEAIVRLDDLAAEGEALTLSTSKFGKVVQLASLMQRLREALDAPGVMDSIMALQGCKLGFCTDKDKNKDGSKGPGYSMPVVRDVTAEALIRGATMNMNEANIIASNLYLTKEFFTRKLRQMDGLQDVRLVFDVPVLKEKGALQGVKISWKYKGVAGEQVLALAIRVNEFMGSDAIQGKATRKAKAWLYTHLTGSEMPEGEVEDGAINVTATAVESKVEDLKEALKSPESPADPGAKRGKAKVEQPEFRQEPEEKCPQCGMLADMSHHDCGGHGKQPQSSAAGPDASEKCAKPDSVELYLRELGQNIQFKELEAYLSKAKICTAISEIPVSYMDSLWKRVAEVRTAILFARGEKGE